MTTFPSFPALPGLAFPVKRSPIWSTLAQDSWSGKSAPIQLWTYPRRKFELTFDVLRSTSAFLELQALEGFVNQVGGSAQPFSFTDTDDQQASLALFGVGDGITTTFQLLRPWGGFYEPVFLPRAGFTVYNNGTSTSAFSVGSANNGQIVFTTAPANGAALTWSGGFDWLCRFNADSYDFSKFMSGLWQLGKIDFTTVKL